MPPAELRWLSAWPGLRGLSSESANTAHRVGARNASQAWIRSGLQAGQQVIVYPPAAVREGTRVRVRAV